MNNSKQEEIECIFLGPEDIAHGLFERDERGLWGKDFTWAFWKNKVPLIYAPELLDYTYIDLKKYSILDKTLTSQKVRVYFRGLARQEELIFGKNIPTEIMVKIRVLETERNVYRNRFSELLKITKTSSYDELRKELLAKESAISKKLSGNQQYLGGQGGQPPQK